MLIACFTIPNVIKEDFTDGLKELTDDVSELTDSLSGLTDDVSELTDALSGLTDDV